MTTAALLDRVIEDLYARHTTDAGVAQAARREYEDRRGKVHQDDPLWEAWSSAFIEWFVVERVEQGAGHHDDELLPPAARTYRELVAAGRGDELETRMIRALVTSQRSLFEVRAVGRGHLEVLDLLGGAEVEVAEARTLHGVEVGDVAELRLIGAPGSDGEQAEVRFGRTFIYHPKAARGAIVARARHMLEAGATRRDVIDQIAQLRIQITRYRHVPAARVYELGSRLNG
ncbi:MAG: hypothetical protein NT062_00015, partial [Proteobacteria bacterium]|nr:hypothetical protein [Pseudomonadota bacterium]